MDLGSTAAGIGALADDTRRRLYEYVVAQADPVGREQAADALGIALHKASFHLDRLVGEGLLEAEYRRLSGRSGPGAGRPSKLYRRADRQLTVSLPPRRYDLVGEILASAVGRVGEGASLEAALREAARAEGLDLGRGAGSGATGDGTLGALAETLRSQGYEPRVTDDGVVLANCPFDALARKHTALVCGLNRDFVQGVADGLPCSAVEARLDPAPGRCCVTAHRTG
ncbi:helix-turn-helix domain-containing protein [Nocardioides sp. TF02-7]|uniref:helix-turn-helix transcriptional regulator n=1 Tax=Nocardioides sp. TF02-7 TaxID=2917724 RepID=UPI001F055D36|nr:helix-turn-helix domain-containing protein [Nocardioides sp. TF02-7]UMG94079.1 transcriptional regulator [Nocardioides sp. TF02-7]